MALDKPENQFADKVNNLPVFKDVLAKDLTDFYRYYEDVRRSAANRASDSTVAKQLEGLVAIAAGIASKADLKPAEGGIGNEVEQAAGRLCQMADEVYSRNKSRELS